MTGRMESVENLVRQRERFAAQRQVFHPSHRPLEIAGAIPTFPQPDDDTLQTDKQQNQGDTSTGLTQGTFLLGRLNAYVHGLRETGGEVVSADEQKATLINAYNALTIRWVVENYPTKSIHGTPNPFRERRHTLGGASVSLDEIEELLRESGDPRIHSALVCASLSCPPLRREAYVGSRINEQLDENTREWLANTELNRFDPRRAEAEVSSIFSWYEEDFATYSGGLEGFLRHYGPPETMAALGNKRLRISFLSYHWGLNDQSDVGKDYSFFELAIDWVKGWLR